MQLHQLKPVHKKKARKRTGRGGKKGNYSGRGLKGQKSRSGHNLQPFMREFIKRYPKLRGYRFGSSQVKPAVVNLWLLGKEFPEKATITPQILLEKGLVSGSGGKIPKVKILSKGEVTKALFVEGCEVSMKAKELIEKAGGKISSRLKVQS